MGENNNLSNRQKQILNYIIQTIKDEGYPPTVREIGQAVGLKSSSTVHAHLLKLEEKGYIKRDPTKPRAIIPLHDIEDLPVQMNKDVKQLPLIGNVAAGTPIFAVENIEAYINVPDELVGYGNHYLLKVQGESMIEAGILDGDYLVVRQQPDAQNGEIVVAMIEEEATVKRFYKKGDSFELHPENSSMQPIITNKVTVLGKVKGLFRIIK